MKVFVLCQGNNKIALIALVLFLVSLSVSLFI